MDLPHTSFILLHPIYGGVGTVLNEESMVRVRRNRAVKYIIMTCNIVRGRGNYLAI